MKQANTKAKSFDNLFDEYDKARAKAKEAQNEQDDLKTEIKSRLEAQKLEEVDSIEFTCVYKFEKDKETEVFDEETFAEKEPKKYNMYLAVKKDMEKIMKKYVKKEKAKGARKLLITRKNSQEE